jgi:hypothetical protein
MLWPEREEVTGSRRKLRHGEHCQMLLAGSNHRRLDVRDIGTLQRREMYIEFQRGSLKARDHLEDQALDDMSSVA